MKFIYFALTALIVVWLRTNATCDGLLPSFDAALEGDEKAITVVRYAGCCAIEDRGELFFNLMRSIYQPLGITVKTKTASSRKAKAMMASNDADILIADSRYAVFSQPALYPNTPIFSSNIVAVVKKGRFPNWRGLGSLRELKSSWVRGNHYQNDLSIGSEFIEVSDNWAGLQMLVSNRVDVFVVDHAVVLPLLTTENSRLLKQVDLKPLPPIMLFPVYPLSMKSQSAAAIYDCRLQKLHNMGVVQQLFRDHNVEFPPLLAD
jgi:polar amino acid transport system substrate-binding protein